MNAQLNLMIGNCLERMRELPDNSVDSIVTDPPYGLSFMGKKWDYDVPSVEIWAECLRVLKPGGHLLAFAGTRTQHRMAVRIEDAGFEIRDMIAWVYGSGFPKSHNLDGDRQGWGTALKPALEPITVARKPLIGTVAANVLAHGTGAINVDGCRVDSKPRTTHARGNVRGQPGEIYGGGKGLPSCEYDGSEGRWPANLIHDGSQMVLDLFPETKSGVPGVRRKAHDTNSMSGRLNMTGEQEMGYGDTGSAARFFYCAKTAKKDRGEANNHPTVKPTDLMRYLCRLVTQPGGTVLDPFMGSGSTGKAAMLEGFDFIGIEMNSEYFAIAENRIGKIARG